LRPSSTEEGSKHVELLEKIEKASRELVDEKFGLKGLEAGFEGNGGALRCFIHYQPTY